MSDSQAREQALLAYDEVTPKPTSLITYRSSGQVIAIGGDDALGKCKELPPGIDLGQISTSDPGNNVQVSGYLGEFIVSVTDQHGNVTSTKADAILDLHENPILNREMLPPGYFHVAPGDWDQQQLVEQLENLVGEFDKPKYFDYDASICAHAVNGKTVCSLCIDACPADAIQSLVDRIEVNPFLCQGGGSCTTVCPSGAIRYLYPGIRDNGKRLRNMLRVYQEQGGEKGIILFHGESYSPQAYLQAHDNLLPVRVEELASVGMELCLSALAFGATQVVLFADDQVPASSLDNLNRQLDWLRVILVNLGLDPLSVSICSAEAQIAKIEVGEPIEAAISDLPDSKRNAFFQALDHLTGSLKPVEPLVELPAPAPFGEVIIDAVKCTLCMACVGACPGKALQDGANREVPEVFFIEANCLQCSACVQTCPEDAITLAPRMVFDRELRNRAHELNSDTPFACISCGKAFASTSVISRMQEKLKGHYMFESERALNRLKMCEDCRVADIVQDPEAMNGQFGPSNQSRH